MSYSRIGNTGRKRAQRMFPIYEGDVCDYCGGTKTLQRHHIDHNLKEKGRRSAALRWGS